MTRFVTSPIDPRKLSMLPHQIARQHPGRREHLHGKVQDDLPKPNRLWLWVGRVIMAACTAYALHLWIVK